MATQPAPAPLTGDAFVDRLDKTLQRQGIGKLAPGDPVRLTGGASYETWSFDVSSPRGLLPMIMRRMPQDVPPASDRSARSRGIAVSARARSRRTRTRCLSRADRGRRPGPWLPGRTGGGETLARRVLRDDHFAAVRPRLAYECGAILARIHSVDVATLPPLETLFAPDVINRLDAEYQDLGVARAVFALAFRWLRDNCPSSGRPARLVHGDFRNGNLIFGGDGCPRGARLGNLRI